MYPIDAIKVCFPSTKPPMLFCPALGQTIDADIGLFPCAQTRMQILSPTPTAVYNGVIQSTYRIATGEGILNLWRGMSSVVVGAGASIPKLLSRGAFVAKIWPCTDDLMLRACARRLLCHVRGRQARHGRQQGRRAPPSGSW